MKSGAGKQKGSQFERDVCKKLSLWLSGDNNPNLLWRSAMSGGRSTVMGKIGKVNKEQSADISATGLEGHPLIDKFAIECKFYKDLGIDKFLLREKCKLKNFWNEICKVADKNEKLPMLIAKQNFFPEIVIFWKYSLKNFLFSQAFPFTEIHYGINGNEVVVAKFNDLLNCTTLNTIKLEK